MQVKSQSDPSNEIYSDFILKLFALTVMNKNRKHNKNEKAKDKCCISALLNQVNINLGKNSQMYFAFFLIQ